MGAYTKIKSLKQLKQCAKDNNGIAECFILLNGGLKSSKDIHYYGDGEWSVFHNISDEYIDYNSDKEFENFEGFIMNAMEKGALYQY